jgi:hypothetical protein
MTAEMTVDVRPYTRSKITAIPCPTPMHADAHRRQAQRGVAIAELVSSPPTRQSTQNRGYPHT